jgi:hypothetical protein
MPLSHLASPEQLAAFEKEAFDLSCNPRGSESSGGALALRLVCKLRFGEDQVGQGSSVGPPQTERVVISFSGKTCRLMVGYRAVGLGLAGFVSSILDRVQERLDASRVDIVRAARDLPVHGLLQLLQSVSLWLPLVFLPILCQIRKVEGEQVFRN